MAVPAGVKDDEMTQPATQIVPLEQRHDQFLKTVNMPLGVAARWHDRDEISGDDQAALLECLRGLEGAYRDMIPALAENGADDKELAAWILAAQSFTRTIETVEDSYPAFVVARLQQLADWHAQVAQPYTLTDLVWNVREAKTLLDRRYNSIEQHRADSAEYHRQQLEVAQDCGAVINEIATEIAPSAIAQWGRGDVTKPVEALVESFARWAEWRTNQPVSDESEIVARAKSVAVDAALSTLDKLLVDVPIAEPKATATVHRIKKAEIESKISVALNDLKKSGKKCTTDAVVEKSGCSKGAVSGSDAWQTKGRGRKRKAKANAVVLSAATLNREASSDESPADQASNAQRQEIFNRLTASSSEKERQETARFLAEMTPDQQDEFFEQAARDARESDESKRPPSRRKTL